MIVSRECETIMNKLMAILFSFGTLAGFGLSTKTSFQVQDQTSHGEPIGKPYTVCITDSNRAFYTVFGAACMAASLYFVARIRRDDAR